ncbi:Cytochrome c oxidase polypeptide I [Caenispirillum salinarum AK4]|uniref:Cytochrome c oxidase polypeptide I n=1 Tax=Caenispirillum salinarum AK4 TaxID=1238182 RepID=K9H2I2_9PROT|nr:cbb3-type cytochrome c oxidase subunit I [Caenispirillum salinarum]EKV31787.1 Cytochrome c oxidase polypeptide I [Caenispirillum salinarum AK4]
MSTIAADAKRPSYLTASLTLWSWLSTTDHKRIGMLYLISITVLFAVGGLAATWIRVELITPGGDVMSADGYNKAFTIHGVIMVWFFLVPSIPTVLGNFVLPLMIGAKDVAFPRLNLASWYIFMAAAIMALYFMLVGGVDTGWTFYTPYSSMFSNTHVTGVIAAVFIVGFSSIATGVNFIVTVHKMRAPGMTWFRMPIMVWNLYATALVMVLATPVLAISLFLVAVERLFGIGIFDPTLGGDPLLFQHLFWFYSHPAVYIMILPGMGVTTEIIACFARRRIFGYKFVAFSAIAIAVIGFGVWGHHMFVAGQSVVAAVVFSFMSFLIAVPSAIKVYAWTATLYKGEILIRTPLLYALSFILLFVLGGITGLILASLALDVHVTDTYFVIAHFHFIMVGASVSAYLGGIHFWWPKMTGRLYPEGPALVAALMVGIGFVLTFMPQFWAGYLGMPRRYHEYPEEFQIFNVLSSGGAVILAIGYALPLVYLLWSLKYGERAGENPWGATGLEWSVPSPPPEDNFDRTPIVDDEAYSYRPYAPQVAQRDPESPEHHGGPR